MAEKKVFVNAPLVWIDLEMTGLSPESQTIVEIAVTLTNNDLRIVEQGPDVVIHQPNSVLEKMEDWPKRVHMRTGLTERIQVSTTTMEQAERRVLNFLAVHCKEGESPLCGNSVGQDRLFMRKYMPKLNKFLSYRIIDVSTLKELVRRWYPKDPVFSKKNTHRAHSDIMESIEELRYYRNKYFV